MAYESTPRLVHSTVPPLLGLFSWFCSNLAITLSPMFCFCKRKFFQHSHKCSCHENRVEIEGSEFALLLEFSPNDLSTKPNSMRLVGMRCLLEILKHPLQCKSELCSCALRHLLPAVKVRHFVEIESTGIQFKL